jgi:hypothetical protein
MSQRINRVTMVSLLLDEPTNLRIQEQNEASPLT